MRIQANPTAASALSAAKTKSGRTAHAGSTKAARTVAAPAAATSTSAAAATTKVASAAKAAAAAATPETYGGAGSLLDAHA